MTVKSVRIKSLNNAKNQIFTVSVYKFIFIRIYSIRYMPQENSVHTLLYCGNAKSSPTTHLWRSMGERMYSSYLFMTSVLYGGEWSASRPGRALSSGKGTPVPFVQEAGWASAEDRTPIARSSSP
jgi:hypothetical protein